MPTIEGTQKGYARLWDEATLTKLEPAAKLAHQILKHKDRYLQVEHDIGMPWIMVAAIHMRESSMDFKAHMHNGDPLSDYTYHVPPNRPKVGHGPPFSFEESTDDAFKMPGKEFDKYEDMWTLELMLFSTEGYNGWGYLSRGNSPYIWAWTSLYHGGKYISDGVYSESAWDEQPGAAAMFKALAAVDESAKAWCERRAGKDGLPTAAIKNATRKERNATAGGVAATTTGTAGTLVEKPASTGGKVAVTFASATFAIVGLAVAIVAGVLLARKSQALYNRFHGTGA